MFAMKRVGLTAMATLAMAAAYGQVPQLQGYSPKNGPVGTVITFNGLNLDRFTKLQFAGGATVPVTTNTGSMITVPVPTGAQSGNIVLLSDGKSTLTISPGFTVTTSTGSGSGGGGNTGSTTPFVAPPHIPAPAGAMTGHPRLFIRQDQLPMYQQWANTKNPIFVALQNAAVSARSKMIQGTIPSTDNGDAVGNSVACPTEGYAELFALMSLVDPVVANRADWAQRAHDLIMYVVNKCKNGPGQLTDPWISPQFASFNRSRWYGEGFPLVVDWCYSTFSAADKQLLRKVFLQWIQDNIYGYSHPNPVGMTYSSALTQSQGGLRWASNNYYCNHARQIGMMAMSMDPADDVPATSTDPAAGTLRDYIGNVTGAWLYQLEKLEQTDTKGGFSPEGMMYGESDTSGISMLLLAMNTAGTDNTSAYGTSAGLATSPWWTQELPDSYIHSMSPAPTILASYLGPTYQGADYGDNDTYWTINYIRTFGPLALIARNQGNQPLYDKIRWIISNYEPGGGTTRINQIQNCMNAYGPMIAVMYFLVMDPAAPAPQDPRVTMPTDYMGLGQHRILSRTDWGPNATWFSYRGSWITTDHNPQDVNKFELYRKGEWLTKGRQGYGCNVNAPDLQNGIAIQNSGSTTTYFLAQELAKGSAFSYSSAGDPTVLASLQPDYIAVQGDATNLYNCPTIGATDVAHASRSLIYLKPDVIVEYDRVTSKTAGKYKRWYLNTQNLATVSGNVAKAVTPKGQKLYVTSLLPLSGTVAAQSVPKSATGPDMNETANFEPMANRIQVEDPSNPLDARFLHVVEGSDAAQPVGATLVRQDAGDAFDGATFGAYAVLFKKDIKTAFSAVTFTVPCSVTTVFVADLKPNTGYVVTKTTTATGIQITVAPGQSGVVSDSAGTIKL